MIKRLSADLRRTFPSTRGLSVRNLNYMRAFAEAWQDEKQMQQSAAAIPWFHNCMLLDKVKDPAARRFYVERVVEEGWSRRILASQIESHRYSRQGQAVTNFIDLLFYHLKLHCYVVVELKAGEFEPEYAGKLNFYLSAVDDLVRDKEVDGPTIGLLLCRKKNRLIAEYALRDIDKPIRVANVQLTRMLPDRFEGTLPTIEELESELSEQDTSKDGD